MELIRAAMQITLTLHNLQGSIHIVNYTVESFSKLFNHISSEPTDIAYVQN